MESYQLNQSLRSTSELLGWDEDEVRTLWNQVNALPVQVKRIINPMDAGLSADEDRALAFFVAGLRCGLFISRWSVVCPVCGSVVESQEALQHFHQDSYICPLCESPVSVDLDTTVDVSFTPNGSFYPEKTDPYDGSKENYQLHYTSGRYLRHPALRDYIADSIQSFSVLGLWEFGKVAFRVKAGEHYRIINMETRSTLNIISEVVPSPKASFLDKMIKHHEIHGDNRPIQTLETDLKEEGFELKSLEVKPGRIELWVHNQIQRPVGLLVIKTNWPEFKDLLSKNVPHAKKVLTGKRLVTDQSFRDFLLNDGLPPDFRMPVSGLTLLFTNLHDSVSLFRNLGDNRAYEHIQSHYVSISGVIKANHGALVKTMGDQIMAVFSQPQDGFHAASEILHAMEEYNKTHDVNLKLQASLHEDKALAVKANRTLDFFGSSVNKCAKLLVHTKPGEIWVTGRFLENSGTARLPGKMGYTCIQQQVVLDLPTSELVYQCLLSE